MQKVIAIIGPTAVGKSDYAVQLAKKVNGAIISADSRQVYRGLDIGSGKITKREMKGVPHYLLDVADPKKTFSVAQFQKKGLTAIKEIIISGKTPIICGGTGFYVDALIYENNFPTVAPNKTLRKKLQKESAETLFKQLKKLDPARAKTIDLHNKIRLIRAIEIATTLGKVPAIKRVKRFGTQWHYIDLPDDILKQKIKVRLQKRLKQGMIKEVTTLHNNGVSWKRLESFGLEYRYIAQFLQQKISKEEMLTLLENAIWHYAKRQRTWFKKYGK